MEKEKAVRLEQFGFSQRDLLHLFLLDRLSKQDDYLKSLYLEMTAELTEKKHSYDYLCKVAKRMETEQLLSHYKDGNKHVYSISEKGKERLSWYRNSYQNRLVEVNKVVERFLHDLTKSYPYHPVTEELSSEYRSYFAKLVSVKDLVRYVALKTGIKRYSFFMGEIKELLSTRYGWESSNGYLYDIAKEMELNGLIEGHWEGETRTKRIMEITDEGKHHFQQIEMNTRERLQRVHHFLRQILDLLGEPS